MAAATAAQREIRRLQNLQFDQQAKTVEQLDSRSPCNKAPRPHKLAAGVSEEMRFVQFTFGIVTLAELLAALDAGGARKELPQLAGLLKGLAEEGLGMSAGSSVDGSAAVSAVCYQRIRWFPKATTVEQLDSRSPCNKAPRPHKLAAGAALDVGGARKELPQLAGLLKGLAEEGLGMSAGSSVDGIDINRPHCCHFVMGSSASAQWFWVKW
eukprot:gene5034-5276_t